MVFLVGVALATDYPQSVEDQINLYADVNPPANDRFEEISFYDEINPPDNDPWETMRFFLEINGTDPDLNFNITYYVRTGGIGYRNGTTIVNGTVIQYWGATTLNLTAVASAGYNFTNWSWDGGVSTSTSNPYYFTLTDNEVIILDFEYYTVSVPTPTAPYVDPQYSLTETLTFYYCQETQEVNEVVGYAALTDPPNAAANLQVTTSGVHEISWGTRIYVQSNGSTTELTGGTPEAIMTHGAGNATEMLSASYTFAQTNLILGRQALRFDLYSRWDSGAWTYRAVYITDYLYYRRLASSQSTFYGYSSQLQTNDTIATFYWGTPTYESGVANVTFYMPVPSDWQSYYLSEGNFLSFLLVPYTLLIGNLFYALIVFGLSMSIYIRYRNISMIVLLIVILGGTGGVFNAFVGEAYLAIVWLVAAFGLGLVLWRVFR